VSTARSTSATPSWARLVVERVAHVVGDAADAVASTVRGRPRSRDRRRPPRPAPRRRRGRATGANAPASARGARRAGRRCSRARRATRVKRHWVPSAIARLVRPPTLTYSRAPWPSTAGRPSARIIAKAERSIPLGAQTGVACRLEQAIDHVAARRDEHDALALAVLGLHDTERLEVEHREVELHGQVFLGWKRTAASSSLGLRRTGSSRLRTTIRWLGHPRRTRRGTCARGRRP